MSERWVLCQLPSQRISTQKPLTDCVYQSKHRGQGDRTFHFCLCLKANRSTRVGIRSYKYFLTLMLGPLTLQALASLMLHFAHVWSIHHHREVSKKTETCVGFPSPDNNSWILHWIYTHLSLCPWQIFYSISQQICQRQKRCRNASLCRHRDGTFQSFVLRGCSEQLLQTSRPLFFVSHLVVWGVTARPSKSIAHILSPNPPLFPKGMCMF